MVAGGAPDPRNGVPLQHLAINAGAGLVTLEWQPAAAPIELEDAITQEQMESALRAGWAEADRAADDGIELLVLAAGGPGSATAAAAVVAAVTGAEPTSLLGRVVTPAGIFDDNAWMTRCVALRDALLPGPAAATATPAPILTALGGADIAAATGLILGAASRRTPVMIDGPVGAAAALLANEFSPVSRRWVLLPDTGRHMAVRVAAEALRLHPWLDLCLDLGEGAASLAALPMLQTALTLASAGTPVTPGPMSRYDSSGNQIFVGVARAGRALAHRRAADPRPTRRRRVGPRAGRALSRAPAAAEPATTERGRRRTAAATVVQDGQAAPSKDGEATAQPGKEPLTAPEPAATPPAVPRQPAAAKATKPPVKEPAKEPAKEAAAAKEPAKPTPAAPAPATPPAAAKEPAVPAKEPARDRPAPATRPRGHCGHCGHCGPCHPAGPGQRAGDRSQGCDGPGQGRPGEGTGSPSQGGGAPGQGRGARRQGRHAGQGADACRQGPSPAGQGGNPAAKDQAPPAKEPTPAAKDAPPAKEATPAAKDKPRRPRTAERRPRPPRRRRRPRPRPLRRRRPCPSSRRRPARPPRSAGRRGHDPDHHRPRRQGGRGGRPGDGGPRHRPPGGHPTENAPRRRRSPARRPPRKPSGQVAQDGAAKDGAAKDGAARTAQPRTAQPRTRAEDGGRPGRLSQGRPAAAARATPPRKRSPTTRTGRCRGRRTVTPRPRKRP